MDAWTLFHKFSQELNGRIASSQASTPVAHPSSSLIDPALEEGEEPSPPELPKLKLSKSKRGSSSLGASAPSPSPLSDPTDGTKKSTKRTSLKPQEKPETAAVQIPITAVAATSAPTPSTLASKKSKVNINLKERYLWCLSELKLHQLKGEGESRVGSGIQTCWPFVLAVDPIQYPSYYTVISQPMDLSVIERKIKGEKYPQLISILKDVELIRDNAHTFNPGDHSILSLCLSLSWPMSLPDLVR
jgi:hypothetical protein